MKVTALKQQIKNPERVSVFVDGKYSFSLTLSQVVSEKLKVGLELDQENLLDFKEKSTNEKLRMKAMNWVFLRPRSTRELQQYLRRITFQTKQRLPKDEDVTQRDTFAYASDQIIDEFTSRGWVDDAVFASWWVERNSRITKSKSYLRSELMGKGINREIIDSVLSDKDETSILYDLIVKCRAKTKYQDEQKLLRYLVSKGFSYSSVTEALKLGAEDNLG